MKIIDTGITEDELRQLGNTLMAEQKQPGEFTVSDMTKANGGNPDKWRRILDKAVQAGSLTSRSVAHSRFYKKV